MLASLLVTLLLVEDVNSPPGTVMPNKDELVKTFREQFKKSREPMDNYARHQLYPEKQTGVVEVFIQMHNDYCKAHTRDHLGVERLSLLSPEGMALLIKLPHEETWKVNFKKELDAEERKKVKQTWLAEAGVSDFGEGDWGLASLTADPPRATVTKVTAERAGSVPVYRFHFTRQGRGRGGEPIEGTIDVDPARSWVVVKAAITQPSRPGYRQDLDFTYEGQVHGRPALKKLVMLYTQKTPEGKTETLSQRTTDVIQFVEHANPKPAEYTPEHYQLAAGNDISTWTYVAAGAVIAVVVVGLYALIARRRRTSLAPAEWSKPA